jgi:hypothetical protein
VLTVVLLEHLAELPGLIALTLLLGKLAHSDFRKIAPYRVGEEGLRSKYRRHAFSGGRAGKIVR